jgi:hypothetical protein
MVTTAKYGEWAFLAGVLLAIVLGLLQGAGFLGELSALSLLLVLLGLVVGVLTVTAKETDSFLVSAVALLLVGSAGLGSIDIIGSYLAAVLSNVRSFVAPAALVVALLAVFRLASKR